MVHVFGVLSGGGGGGGKGERAAESPVHLYPRSCSVRRSGRRAEAAVVAFGTLLGRREGKRLLLLPSSS